MTYHDCLSFLWYPQVFLYDMFFSCFFIVSLVSLQCPLFSTHSVVPALRWASVLLRWTTWAWDVCFKCKAQWSSIQDPKYVWSLNLYMIFTCCFLHPWGSRFDLIRKPFTIFGCEQNFLIQNFLISYPYRSTDCPLITSRAWFDSLFGGEVCFMTAMCFVHS